MLTYGSVQKTVGPGLNRPTCPGPPFRTLPFQYPWSLFGGVEASRRKPRALHRAERSPRPGPPATAAQEPPSPLGFWPSMAKSRARGSPRRGASVPPEDGTAAQSAQPVPSFVQSASGTSTKHALGAPPFRSGAARRPTPARRESSGNKQPKQKNRLATHRRPTFTNWWEKAHLNMNKSPNFQPVFPLFTAAAKLGQQPRPDVLACASQEAASSLSNTKTPPLVPRGRGRPGPTKNPAQGAHTWQRQRPKP
jgi:hypothetical protein